MSSTYAWTTWLERTGWNSQEKVRPSSLVSRLTRLWPLTRQVWTMDEMLEGNIPLGWSEPTELANSAAAWLKYVKAPSLDNSIAGLGLSWAKAASFSSSASARLRATAMASTVATASRKWTSSSVNLRLWVVCAPRTPNARPCSEMATVTPL